MTLNELYEHIMHQTNNDLDDLGDYQPSIERYINEGYDKLVEAYDNTHIDEEVGGEIKYPSLVDPDDVPALPLWMHRAIADYATYMMYRNGNAIKQNRGVPYYQAFMDVLTKARFPTGKKFRFRNLYNEK